MQSTRTRGATSATAASADTAAPDSSKKNTGAVDKENIAPAQPDRRPLGIKVPNASPKRRGTATEATVRRRSSLRRSVGPTATASSTAAASDGGSGFVSMYGPHRSAKGKPSLRLKRVASSSPSDSAVTDESELTALREQIRELRDANSKLEEDKRKLASELDTLRHESEPMVPLADLEDIAAHAESLRTELSECKKELAEHVELLSESRSMIEELLASNPSAEATVTGNEVVESLQEQIRTLENTVLQLENELAIASFSAQDEQSSFAGNDNTL